MKYEAIITVAVSALVSGTMTGIILYYIRRYIDSKLQSVEAAKKERDQIHKKRSIAEQKRRQAEGRLLFWLYYAVKNKQPTTDLDTAMANYDAAELDQKQLDQEIIALYDHDKG